MEFRKMIDFLRKRLAEQLPGFEAQKLMIPESRRAERLLSNNNAKQSGVLLLLFYEEGHIKTLLIERVKDKSAHSGQISLPGGKWEEIDENIIQTALREAEEEIGLDSTKVEVLGVLSSLYIPVSNFSVSPVIAFTEKRPDVYPSEAEVAQILSPSLKDIFNSKTDTDVFSPFDPKFTWKSPAYLLSGPVIVWGATAMIFSELEILLKDFIVK